MSSSEELKPQLSEEARKDLEEQGYRVIGSHSAVKTCHWTKSMVKGDGGCYKLLFYGIMSDQCMQMTTSISCANRCSFCWRGYKAPVSKDWKWETDEPEKILEGSKGAHHDLLVGFKGNKNVPKKTYERTRTIKHVALSLTGEPLIYPKMNKLLKLYNKEGISTFLVTNGQYPEQIRDLEPVTQLYVSIDAPNKELLKTIDIPLFKDYWDRMLKSLEYLSQKKERTCVRLTMVKGINDVDPKGYADLISKGDSDFIEVKAYVYVGASRDRLGLENSPLHEEVVTWCYDLAKHLPDYEIVAEHIPSRVVLFAKKKYKIDGKWNTWIDFPKWDKLVNSGEEFDSMDYNKRTPATGISGKGTKDRVSPHQKKMQKKQEELLQIKK